MGYFLEANNELCALHDLLQLITQEGKANGNCLEVLNCLLTIHYDPDAWDDFCRIKEDFLYIGGEAAKIGWDRASRIYTSRKDRPTKPSYLKRLEAYPDKPRRCDKNSYMFSWNGIPGTDNGRLIESLTKNFGIEWVKTAKIEKTDVDKTIKVFTGKNSLSLKLNDKDLEVIVEIDDGRTGKFLAEMKHNVLNIYRDFLGLNQIEKIGIELAKKPGFSNLSFVILRPADLHDQFRPGYVPCPIAGDFKFRNGQLNLSVMFRTNDAFAVGYADIYYLRSLQMATLNQAQKLTGNEKLKKGRIGDLNLYFCRTFVEKSKRSKKIDSLGSRTIKIIPLVNGLVKFLEDHQPANEEPPTL
jgi:hypothetical protein